MRTDVHACNCTWGCTDTVEKSALKGDFGEKSLAPIGESSLRQQHAGPTLYHPRYIPRSHLVKTSKWIIFAFISNFTPVVKDSSILRDKSKLLNNLFVASGTNILTSVNGYWNKCKLLQRPLQNIKLNGMYINQNQNIFCCHFEQTFKKKLLCH